MNRLGRSVVHVSPLGFGAAPIGNLYTAIDDETARGAVDAAWAGGVRYFDTAPHYGLGLSEERLGAALAGRPRSQFAVSTKVGRLLVRNPTPVGDDLADLFAVPDDLTRIRDYSRDGVLRSLEASLGRLGLDRVDIVYVHDPDDVLDTAIGVTVPALVDLREQGVIGAVGAGMNHPEPLRRLVAECDLDAVMIAGRWSLLERSALPLLDDCAARGVAAVVAAPFNSGLLAQPWPPDEATFDYGPAAPGLLDRARTLARVCERHGAQLPQAALQFPLRHPAVASVVAGLQTAQQARVATDLAGRPTSTALWADLEAAETSMPSTTT